MALQKEGTIEEFKDGYTKMTYNNESGEGGFVVKLPTLYGRSNINTKDVQILPSVGNSKDHVLLGLDNSDLNGQLVTITEYSAETNMFMVKLSNGEFTYAYSENIFAPEECMHAYLQRGTGGMIHQNLICSKVLLDH